MIPAYLDTARLCIELCICERTVDAWVRQGILPAPRQRGGKRLWKWTEVESCLDEGAQGVAPLADPEAERIRNATQRLAEEAAAHRRGHVRGRNPRLSGKSDLCEAGAGNETKLPSIPRDG